MLGDGPGHVTAELVVGGGQKDLAGTEPGAGPGLSGNVRSYGRNRFRLRRSRLDGGGRFAPGALALAAAAAAVFWPRTAMQRFGTW
jgi:hypothetical protein